MVHGWSTTMSLLMGALVEQVDLIDQLFTALS